MSTKGKLLELLESNRGESLSGEQIASILGVSRAAVWKAVRKLEKEGYSINAATNRGYSLADESDILSAEGIAPYLSGVCAANTALPLDIDNDKTFGAVGINVFNSLESTNTTAKEMALKGFGHGTVVIADSQTGGRGRYGRTFCSPPGTGLYISFILQSSRLGLPSVTMATAVSAVAAVRAIRAVTGRNAGIKWVNDIIIDDKKVCGILSEGITDLESGEIDWIVVGIGINIRTDGLPEELLDVAGAICPEGEGGAVRNRLAAELINELLTGEIWMDLEKTRMEYRNSLVVLGERVTVIRNGITFEATAIDIDELCRLIVRLSDGGVETLSSGEVSIRRGIVNQK